MGSRGAIVAGGKEVEGDCTVSFLGPSTRTAGICDHAQMAAEATMLIKEA